MKNRFDFFFRWIERSVTGTGIVGALLFLLVMGVTTYEVLMRYIFNSPTTWSMEVSVIFTMWGTFLGAAYTLKQDGHTSVDILINRISGRKKRVTNICILIFILLYWIFLTWASLVPSVEAYIVGEVTQSYTRTPLYLLMFSIPVGGVLLILEIVRELFQVLRPKRQ